MSPHPPPPPPTLPNISNTPQSQNTETPKTNKPDHTPLIQQTLRPGRKSLRTSPDINLDKSYGDSVDIRDPSHIRIYFQNVKGLTYSTSGQDYAYYLSCISTIDADITGMAETNSTWQHHHLQTKFKANANRQFQMTKVSFSSPSQEIEPTPENESYQAGGTVTLATTKTATISFGQPFSDPTGLGRWSGLHFRGKSNKIFTTITAYRVCTSSIRSAPLGSSFAREYEHFKGKGMASLRPRKLFLDDLALVITTFQAAGHSILLMMDSNGQLSDDDDLKTFITQCDLADLHSHSPAPSTYIGSATRRIDHMLGCQTVLDAMHGSGSLSYTKGPQSDHRGLFVDLQPATLLGQSSDPIAIAQHKTRLLKSGNPEAVESYHTSMMKYYEDHNMEERIDWIKNNLDTLDRATVRNMIEQWDGDQGRAMQHSERQLSRSTKPHQWSPALRNAGLLYRYWRLRHREATTGFEDYSATYDRMLRQTATHDPHFQLPHLGETLTTDIITTNLNTAGKYLNVRKIRSNFDTSAI